MEKITRSQFIQKYGFDPHDPNSFNKAPAQGAVGGSVEQPGSVKPVSFTTEQMQRLSGQSSTPVTFTAEQKAYIDSIGGPSAFGGTPAPQTDSTTSSTSDTSSDYKPGKFIQSMKDFRPDYSGGTLNDISEGLGDVSVGVAKGLIRTPVNILQAVTPDAMWGENSLLNSDSERAKAFAEATKGQTGLQKAGATAFDLAAMFTPVGAEKGAATIAGLAGKNTGKLVGMASKLLPETGALSKAGIGGKALGLAEKLAPSVAESVVGGGIVGHGGQNAGTDALLGAAFPAAGWALGRAGKAFETPQAKQWLAGIKDWASGTDEYTKGVMDDTMKLLSEQSPEAIKAQQEAFKNTRDMFTPVFNKLRHNIYGTGTQAEREFGDAVDYMTMKYLPYIEPTESGMLNVAKSMDVLKGDLSAAGQNKDYAFKLFKDNTQKVSNLNKSITSTINNLGINKSGLPYNNAINFLKKEAARITGGAQKVSAEQLDALAQSIWAQKQSLGPDESVARGIYDKLYGAVKKNIVKIGNESGNRKAVEHYVRESEQYSKLKNIEALMNKLDTMQTNPTGLTQQERHGIQLLAGALTGGATGNFMNTGISYAMSFPLVKALSRRISAGKLAQIRTNPVVRAASEIESRALAGERGKLTNIIKDQAEAMSKKFTKSPNLKK